MNQLILDLALPTDYKMHYKGWSAWFYKVGNENEIVYRLATPRGKHHSDCYTNLPLTALDTARKYAKEAIDTMLDSPPFALMPQSGKVTKRSLPPFLKWLGSKRWAIAKVKGIYDRYPGRRFVDLTLGSGALPLAIAPDRVLACDINHQLIQLWRWVQNSGQFSIELKSEEQYFYECRDRYNELVVNDPNNSEIPQLLYLLCRTSFNGLHRSSSKKAFNAPWGKYKSFGGQVDLSCYRQALKNWEFKVGDFRDSIRLVNSSDFVVFDPPYDSVDGKAFTSYAGRFTREDQAEAAALLERLGVPVVAFNADTPFIREVYQDWDMEEVEVARSVSCNGDRAKAKELILAKNL